MLGLVAALGIILCLYCIIWLVGKTENWLALKQCKKGNHTWEGCICTTCGAINHSWDGCKCTRCGLERHKMEHVSEFSEEGLPDGVDGGLENLYSYGLHWYGEYKCPRCGKTVVINRETGTFRHDEDEKHFEIENKYEIKKDTDPIIIRRTW